MTTTAAPLAVLAHVNKHLREPLEAVSAARRAHRDWPRWCYAPLSVATNALLAFDGVTVDTMRAMPPKLRAAAYNSATTLTAVAAWRMTKGCYQFHPELLEALWSTPTTGNIPSELLHRLPEWCVYVPLPEPETPVGRPAGVFIHLDWLEGRSSLRFLLVFVKPEGATVWPLDVALGVGSVWDGVRSFAGQWLKSDGATLEGAELGAAQRDATALAGQLVNLALYLCTDEPDITGKGRPGNPRPQRVKGGVREFAAPGVRSWAVGERIGAALMRDQHRSEKREHASSGRLRPRAHWRRAHWAVYWTGPKSGEQVPVLRWLAPTLVAADTDEELPVVVRRVE